MKSTLPVKEDSSSETLINIERNLNSVSGPIRDVRIEALRRNGYTVEPQPDGRLRVVPPRHGPGSA